MGIYLNYLEHIGTVRWRQNDLPILDGQGVTGLGFAENPHSGFIRDARTHLVGMVVMVQETWHMEKMMRFGMFTA